MLALGDLLATIDTPTSRVQSGAAAGFSIGPGIFSAPLFDVTKNGQTFVDAGRVTIGSISTDNPFPHDGDQFGYSVGGGYISAPFYDDPAVDSGIVFTSINPQLPSFLRNPFPAAGANFGLAMAFANSKLFVTVGSPNGSTVSGGAVYVFDQRTGYQSTINNPTPSAGDEFGKSLSASQDRLIVGAPGDDAAGQDAGAVYIYDFAGNLLRTITEPTPAAGNRFGSSTFYSYFTTPPSIAVGAPGASVNGADGAGRAYTFALSDGSLIKTYDNPAPAAGDAFGTAVAGINRYPEFQLIVGAPYAEDAGASDAGMAYRFDLPSGTLLESIHNPSPADNDRFGFALLDGGAIGAPGADEHDAVDSGAIYTATPGFPPTLAWDIRPQGRFSQETVISDPWLFVSEPELRDNGGSFLGRVHQFDVATGALVHTYATTNQGSLGRRIAAADNRVAISHGDGAIGIYDATTFALLATVPTENSSLFSRGHRIAMDGDLLVVGHEDSNSFGVVRVYNAASGALIRTLVNPNSTQYDGYGWTVAAHDGMIAVADRSGHTYLYDGPTGNLRSILDTPDGGEDVLVTVASGKVVVGSTRGPTSNKSGTVRIFDAASGELQYSLPGSDHNAVVPTFGSSLAVSGDTLFIGEHHQPSGTTSGKVYVVYLPTGGIIEDLAPPAASPLFGDGLAGLGNELFLGDPLALGPYWEVGRLYRYDTTLDRVYLRDIYGPKQFVENGLPILIAPSGTFSNPTHKPFDSGTFTATIVSPAANDRLGLISEGTDAGQIAVQGNDILYGGSVVATFELQNQGSQLEVTFGSGISDEAIQAITRHVSFENPSEDSLAGDRTINLSITGADGTVQASGSQLVSTVAVEDDPVLTVGDPVAYQPGGSPVALAPGGTIGDVDTTDFNGGWLNVAITTNGTADDRLAIRNEGQGPGQIGVQSQRIITYGGVQLAYDFSRTSGQLPLYLENGATREGIEALLRAITFEAQGPTPATATRTVTFYLSDGEGGGKLSRVTDGKSKSRTGTRCHPYAYLYPNLGRHR